MQFIIGSTNKAKVAAAQKVIHRFFPEAQIEATDVESGVSKQPIGDQETRLGATNRAMAAASHNSVGIGLEGGVRELDGTLYMCNWGALAIPDGTVYTAGGAQIPLPEEIAKEIRNGRELGPVMDEHFKKVEIRHNEGAMGVFTAGTVPRDELFSHIMLLLIGQLMYKMNHS